MGNFFEDFIAHFPQGLFIVGKCIVESEFVGVEPKAFAPFDCFLEFFCHGNQLFDNLSGFDGAVLVALDDVCEKFGEFFLLNNVCGKACFPDFCQLVRKLRVQELNKCAVRQFAGVHAHGVYFSGSLIMDICLLHLPQFVPNLP